MYLPLCVRVPIGATCKFGKGGLWWPPPQFLTIAARSLPKLHWRSITSMRHCAACSGFRTRLQTTNASSCSACCSAMKLWRNTCVSLLLLSTALRLCCCCPVVKGRQLRPLTNPPAAKNTYVYMVCLSGVHPRSSSRQPQLNAQGQNMEVPQGNVQVGHT